MNFVEIFGLGETVGTGVIVILVILTFVQLAPIKVNPWNKILRCIGRQLNTELVEKIDRNEIVGARRRIIRFDDEIRLYQIRHTEGQFNQILDDIDDYERYCKSHPDFPNHQALDAIENIRAIYRKCRDDKDFLI